MWSIARRRKVEGPVECEHSDSWRNNSVARAAGHPRDRPPAAFSISRCSLLWHRRGRRAQRRAVDEELLRERRDHARELLVLLRAPALEQIRQAPFARLDEPRERRAPNLGQLVYRRIAHRRVDQALARELRARGLERLHADADARRERG